ncbi:hypothetical protein QOZ80_1BG0090950 [Eleusine coracana subsp. coracana]|nr:hypothetical protein QOZ80_1BG0090950 [Eleusine coracana subsp. coracana]
MAAAYEKPQASQPPPHLNAAYYGPSIPPPQPAYYGPPPSTPRRSCFGLLCKIIAIVIIALGVTTLVLWLNFRPDMLKATADSATLSRFDLLTVVMGLGKGDDSLHHNLTVNIRLRNPTRFGIRCDYAEAQAAYDDERFGFAPLRPFYLNSKSDQTITVTFNGEAAMGVNDDHVSRTYERESSRGFYYVKVRMYTDLSSRVRVVRRSHYKSKITCVLRLPVPTGGNAGPAPITNLGTKCYVNF